MLEQTKKALEKFKGNNGKILKLSLTIPEGVRLTGKRYEEGERRFSDPIVLFGKEVVKWGTGKNASGDFMYTAASGANAVFVEGRPNIDGPRYYPFAVLEGHAKIILWNVLKEDYEKCLAEYKGQKPYSDIVVDVLEEASRSEVCALWEKEMACGEETLKKKEEFLNGCALLKIEDWYKSKSSIKKDEARKALENIAKGHFPTNACELMEHNEKMRAHRMYIESGEVLIKFPMNEHCKNSSMPIHPKKEYFVVENVVNGKYKIDYSPYFGRGDEPESIFLTHFDYYHESLKFTLLYEQRDIDVVSYIGMYDCGAYKNKKSTEEGEASLVEDMAAVNAGEAILDGYGVVINDVAPGHLAGLPRVFVAKNKQNQVVAIEVRYTRWQTAENSVW